MPKLKGKRGFHFVKELGGALRRGTVSFAAQWLMDTRRIEGRTLDYGCGFGMDADHFSWDAFDPYYRPQPIEGVYDTIVCNHVLNMLTRCSRQKAIEDIQRRLSNGGTAWLIVPRNIPKSGKIAMRRRIQNYVLFDLPSVYGDSKLEIYQLDRDAQVLDQTEEIERRLEGR
ncbi:hypothetical protein [Blastopirellula marina]|uniref:Methyltransferase type 11 domain-containing protein n=1 Tax=Blastopirellula marina TaxID=124 RepID=A0A2S8F9H3_9BACT|nr:hypothetical protein [Blastopirellula marina]PQO28816.1 hypothetical protein C5Y98_23915 [Blastopirellula marina]PTL42089.1 hypothetical protein C5Y97_23930 [Blastopirellula marina]